MNRPHILDASVGRAEGHVDGTVAYLDDFDTEPRGKGWGRKLYERWERTLPSTVREIHLTAMDGHSMYFWQHMGFKQTHPDADGDAFYRMKKPRMLWRKVKSRLPLYESRPEYVGKGPVLHARRDWTNDFDVLLDQLWHDSVWYRTGGPAPKFPRVWPTQLVKVKSIYSQARNMSVLKQPMKTWRGETLEPGTFNWDDRGLWSFVWMGRALRDPAQRKKLPPLIIVDDCLADGQHRVVAMKALKIDVWPAIVLKKGVGIATP